MELDQSSDADAALLVRKSCSLSDICPSLFTLRCCRARAKATRTRHLKPHSYEAELPDGYERRNT